MAIERETGQTLDEIGPVHKIRYRWASERVRGRRILDCCCGSGYGAKILSDEHPEAEVIAVDISEEAIAHGGRYFGGDRIRYVRQDMTKLAFDEPFDTIVSIESVEHVENPQSVLAHFRRLLKPGGNLIASLPSFPTIAVNPYHFFEIEDMAAGTRFFEAQGYEQLEAIEREDAYHDMYGMFHLVPAIGSGTSGDAP